MRDCMRRLSQHADAHCDGSMADLLAHNPVLRFEAQLIDQVVQPLLHAARSARVVITYITLHPDTPVELAVVHVLVDPHTCTATGAHLDKPHVIWTAKRAFTFHTGPIKRAWRAEHGRAVQNVYRDTIRPCSPTPWHAPDDAIRTLVWDFKRSAWWTFDDMPQAYKDAEEHKGLLPTVAASTTPAKDEDDVDDAH
jgi:hypothetical protein